MGNKLMVGYIRVSTRKQGISGLSLEDQTRQINQCALDRGYTILDIFKDVDSGSKDQRVSLLKAITLAKENNATLVVTKIDRLARHERLILDFLDERKKKNAKFNFQVIDQWDADDFIIRILATFAEREYDIICDRNYRALMSRKQRNLDNGLPEMTGIGSDIFKGADNPHGMKGRKKGIEANVKKALNKWGGTIEIIKLLLPKYGNNLKQISKELAENHNLFNTQNKPFRSHELNRLIKRYITKEPLSINTEVLQMIPRGYTVKEYAELNIYDYCTQLRAIKFSYGTIAKHLNGNFCTTSSGGRYHAITIQRLLVKEQENKKIKKVC